MAGKEPEKWNGKDLDEWTRFAALAPAVGIRSPKGCAEFADEMMAQRQPRTRVDNEGATVDVAAAIGAGVVDNGPQREGDVIRNGVLYRDGVTPVFPAISQ